MSLCSCGGAALDLLFDAQLRLDLGGRGEQVGDRHVGDGAVDQRVGVLDEGLFFEGDLGRRLDVDAAPSATGAHDALRAPTRRRADRHGVAGGHGRLAHDLLVVGQLVGQDVALVDPDLDADAAGRGAGLAEAVVDVRAQRVQRHAALAVGLAPRHLRAAETARGLDAHAEGARLLDGLDAALHRAAKGHAAQQLVADPLGDERGVELGLLDLLDVERDLVLLAGDLLEVLLQALGLGAAATDHDARAGRVDVDADAVGVALDLDAAHGRALELPGQVVADLPVLDDEVLVAALLEPARLPVRRDAETETVGVYLLAH